MWLFDITRYGRLHLGAAVLLSLLACERNRPRTTEQVVAAAKTAQLATAPPPQVAPAATAPTPAPDALPEETSPPVAEVTDRTAPVLLATQQLNPTEWEKIEGEWDQWNTVVSLVTETQQRLKLGELQPLFDVF